MSDAAHFEIDYRAMTAAQRKREMMRLVVEADDLRASLSAWEGVASKMRERGQTCGADIAATMSDARTELALAERQLRRLKEASK